MGAVFTLLRRYLAQFVRPVVIEAIALERRAPVTDMGRHLSRAACPPPMTKEKTADIAQRMRGGQTGLDGVKVCDDGTVVVDARQYTLREIRAIGCHRYTLTPVLKAR